ncbi:hypothetical protein, partial [Klebsiella pneumoniae]|uniref:hypothetical protein n=1 Tax=Klebsiella pneumoniae TaxID=573 RepID=UPI004044D9B3
PYYALNLALIIRLAESIAVNVTVSVVPSAETAKARETPVGEAEAIPHVPLPRVEKVLTEAVSTAKEGANKFLI